MKVFLEVQEEFFFKYIRYAYDRSIKQRIANYGFAHNFRPSSVLGCYFCINFFLHIEHLANMYIVI